MWMQGTASPTTARKYRRKPLPDWLVGKKAHAVLQCGLF
jgi:hypothetical protein